VGYKGIRLSAFLQGVGKADGYLNSYYVMPCYQGGTYRKEHLDYWTEQNHDASTPRLSYKSSNNTYTSSFWMKSAAYLRLKNLQLGYDLPSKWMKAIGLKSAYIYANGMKVAETVYKMDGNTLANYMKYNYKYDDQNRMTESEALKWNSTKNTWGKDMCIRYAYQGKTMTTTYYKWNNKKGEYILVPEMTVIMDNPNM
jgi:hypothetical protein